MATYGGGVVFTTTKTFVDVGGFSNTVAVTVADNTYVDFQAHSIHLLGTISTTPNAVTARVERENGAGGWVATAVYDFTMTPVSVIAGSSQSFGLSANNEKTIRLLPGERIMLINQNGMSGGNMRINFSYATYTPST